MTKKDVEDMGNWLAPSLFAVLAVGSLYFASMSNNYVDASRAKERGEKFEMFVQNVESGKLQLTRDRWIHAMRLQRKVEEADRECLAIFAEFLRFSGWVGLSTVVFQAAVLFLTKSRLTKALSQRPE